MLNNQGITNIMKTQKEIDDACAVERNAKVADKTDWHIAAICVALWFFCEICSLFG